MYPARQDEVTPIMQGLRAFGAMLASLLLANGLLWHVLTTNLAAGISDQPLDHAEVLEAGRAAASRMGELLGKIVPRL